jgi:hypothetical protein
MMARREMPGRRVQLAALAAGAAVGAGLVWWQWSRRRAAHRVEGRLVQLEQAAVERLLADERIAGQPIEVAALAPGILELSGAVETAQDASRAVALAQGTPGVRTVLNRLEVLEELERAEAALAQPDGPGSARGETRWLGIGVGTGRRRQARDTDPDRRDDRLDIVERELGVDRVAENPSEPLDRTPAEAGPDAAPEPAEPDDRDRVQD